MAGRTGRKRFPTGLAKVLGRWLLYLTAAFYLLCSGALLYVRFFPPVATMVQLQRWIESREGVPRPPMQYEFVPLGRIADNLEHAVVAAEDSRFFEHRGFDWVEVRRAAETSWERGQVTRGASTITQQLVKNLFLTTHPSILRKVAEIPLAWLAELILPKQRILELYLNVVEWGPGVYGAQAAARHHYGVPAAQLDREEAARLAAVLPAPRTWRPKRMDSSAARILRRMRQMGW